MEPPAGAWRRAADEREPLAALAAARELKEELARWEAHLARKALAEGETWETIGAALGISRQAAWERLRRGIAEEIEADKERVRAQRERLVEKRKGAHVDADEIARAAAELAQRAEELSKRAREAGEVDDELAQLEAELASLDAERDRLDSDMDRSVIADVDPPASNGNAPREDAEDGWVFRLGNLGERIADLVGAAINLGGAVRTAGYHRDVVERELESDGIRPVSVHSFAGSITVVPGDDGVVSVKATKQALDDAGLAAIDVTIADEPGGIAVRATTDGSWSLKSWVALEVRVPESTPLRVRTQAGSVRVEGVGADVECHTNGGSIRVAGSCGAAVLETAGGGIKLDDHDGPVTARTMGGSIKLSGELGPAVEAETIGGSIRIDGIDGSVAATTKGGSVNVNGRFAGTCSVETAGGSLTIGLESGTRVTVEGSGSSASTDVPGLDARGGRITGDVDGGGDGHLVARTIAGAIRIRRA